MTSSPTLTQKSQPIEGEHVVTQIPRKALRQWHITGLATMAAILLYAWYIGAIGGNIHTVVPGQVYRSAQLTGSTLEHVLSTDHIRTVINLRGGRLGWHGTVAKSVPARNMAHAT